MQEPIDAALCEDMRLLYESGKLSVNAICEHVGVGRTTLYRLARQGKWVKRSSAIPRFTAALAETEDGMLALQARRTTFDRLHRMVERELNALARLQATNHTFEPLSPELAARTFASLVKTLGDLKKLENETGSGVNDDAPEDIDAVRQELVLRLERLRTEPKPLSRV